MSSRSLSTTKAERFRAVGRVRGLTNTIARDRSREGFAQRFDLDDWQRLNPRRGQRVPGRLPGKDDAWLFVTNVTELPPIVWVMLAQRIADQAQAAVEGVDVVRAQTDELGGIARINDSGVRILHSARALRKVAVGR